MNMSHVGRCAVFLGLAFTFTLASSSTRANVDGVSLQVADGIRLMTLNLHGYHPMHEPMRYLQDRSGAIHATSSYITYFPIDSVYRGHRKQLDELSRAISKIAPDVLFLQEVGAGTPSSAKDCNEFYSDLADDADGKNSALRLRDRLVSQGSGYTALLACRGNIGWQTDPNTFHNVRVVQQPLNSSSAPQVVFDFDSNPYPQGIIVEGTAILLKAPWQANDSQVLHLPIPQTSETFLLQTARISKPGEPGWYLIANLHGGFKQHHFEDAMAVRRAVGDYLERSNDLANLRGVIVGGDFNAELYRPTNHSGDLFAIPWEISVLGEFDFSNPNVGQSNQLVSDLWKINIDPSDTWGSLGNSVDAHTRIQYDVTSFASFVHEPEILRHPIADSLWYAEENHLCQTNGVFQNFSPSCYRDQMIDHIFISPDLKMQNATIVFSNDNWKSLEGLTDHAGLVVDAKQARIK